jgi:hypothetical protein
LIAADGKEIYARKGLNNCETVGANHGVILDLDRERVFFRELVSRRVSALDFAGKTVFQVEHMDTGAMASDPKTGNLWCLTGATINEGEVVVLDPGGRRVATYRVKGFDIAYDVKGDGFWIVGPAITKVNRKGEIVLEGVKAAWCFVSVAPNARDGTAWIAEREHPEAVGSANRLLLLDSNGQRLRTVELGDQTPFAVACDPETGAAWVVIIRRAVLRVPVDKQDPLWLLDIPATCVTVGSATGQIWVGTEEEVLRLDKNGKRVARYALKCKSSQSWITAR